MKIKFLFVLLFFSFLGMLTLNADCEDVMDIANNISVKNKFYMPSYDEINGEDTENPFVLGIEISNITENIYILVSNDYDSDVITVKYEDTDNGTIVIDSPNIYKKVKMNVRVFSNDETCSSNNSLKSINLETNISNKFYYTSVCLDNPELKICEKSYDTSDLDEDGFVLEAQKEIDKLNRTIIDSISDFFKKYWLFILIPVVVITIIFVITVIVIKRRMNNEY